MNLCIDCKYYSIPVLVPGWFFLPKVEGSPQCGHPDLLSKVDGKPQSSCSIQRGFNSSECGPAGRLFQPKA